MTDATENLRPAEAYAAIRTLSYGMSAVADVLLERVRVDADRTGANSFKTRFGKVYSSTKEARVEILPSATLMDWLRENWPVDEERGDTIIPEHYEDQFDDRQLEQATAAYRGLFIGGEDMATEVARGNARTVLRAAFRPRLVPEKIAPWVIPALIERAKIVIWDVDGEDETHPDRGRSTRHVVIDSEMGEEWPWATVVPAKVTWNARIDDTAKTDAGNALLGQLPQVVGIVGVKEIGA